MRPEVIYLQGPQGTAPLSVDEVSNIRNGNFVITGLANKFYAVPYDFTLPHVGSALFNSLTVLLTVLLAGFLIKNIWLSLVPAILLVLLPRFVFLGQLLTFESISIAFFCLTVWYFPRILKHPDKIKPYVIIGVLSGLLFWTRYNNIIIFPFLIGWLGIEYFFNRKKEIFSVRLLIIPAVAFAIGYVMWPYLWHNFPQSLIESFAFHKNRFIGISIYYWQYLLFTTPIPIIVGFILGIFNAVKKRRYWNMLLIWWIVCSVIIYSVFVFKLGGTRYVSIIYPAIAILAAYGYIETFKKKFIYIFLPILLFLIIEMARFYPYYLDYYNQLIGGVSGAIKQGYDFSWWGEGQREVGLWINNNLPAGSSVGLIVTPKYVFPALNPRFVQKGFVDEKSDADYLVVSWFDSKSLSNDFLQKHEVVYEAKVEGQPLVYLMKKK